MNEIARRWRVLAGGAAAGVAAVVGVAGATASAEPVFPQPPLETSGSGPDGGREATFVGQIGWAASGDARPSLGRLRFTGWRAGEVVCC